jgi:Flagellar hook-length control protein FliK
MASLNALLVELMPRLATAPSAVGAHNLVSIMASPLDALTTQPLPLSILGTQLSAAVKSGIVEAIVLSSTPLSPEQNTGSQHKIVLSDGKQQFELIAKAPVPAGTELQIKIADKSAATVLLKVINEQSVRHLPSSGGAIIQNSTPREINTAPHQTSTEAKTAINNTPLITNRPTTATQQVIQQSVREALPQQQPLRQLVVLLQNLLQQQAVQQQSTLQKSVQQSIQQQSAQQQTPQHSPDLNQRISHLLKQFPTAEQMQQPQPAKMAIENSGVFLESKLTRMALNKQTSPINDSARATPSSEIKSDIKAAIQTLSQWIQKTPTAQPAATPQATSNTHRTDNMLDSDLLVYSAKPAVTQNNHAESSSKSEQNLDILLRQLGRQLMASIARTQINQLESLAARQNNNIDNQGPVNSWVTEIPILNGKDVDNLKIRIDQDPAEQSNERDEPIKKLWTVMLSFDLHLLGKMNVQLKVVEQSVSATVWSSQAETHSKVKKYIYELTHNLKKVGVAVKKVECQLGLPPEQKSSLLKQLVDIRT